MKAAEVLKPGGYLAVWWNVFGDPEREDLYHEATRRVLDPLARSPSDPPDALPFALDTAARRREMTATGAFDAVDHAAHRWEVCLSSHQIGALYATFSSISCLPADQRRAILDRLMEIAERDFGGRVARNMVILCMLRDADRRVHKRLLDPPGASWRSWSDLGAARAAVGMVPRRVP